MTVRRTTDSVEKTARDLRDTVERAGGSMTYDQAKARVEKALNKADHKQR